MLLVTGKRYYQTPPAQDLFHQHKPHWQDLFLLQSNTVTSIQLSNLPICASADAVPSISDSTLVSIHACLLMLRSFASRMMALILRLYLQYGSACCFSFSWWMCLWKVCKVNAWYSRRCAHNSSGFSSKGQDHSSHLLPIDSLQDVYTRMVHLGLLVFQPGTMTFVVKPLWTGIEPEFICWIRVR
jgi:hypothetical protein